MANKILSSEWGGLSDHLIARFYEVTMRTPGDLRSFTMANGSPIVAAPISEVHLDQVQSWTSPFEQQRPDARVSTFSNMLQVGGFTEALNALDRIAGGSVDAFGKAAEQAATVQGRTSMTVSSSVQIHDGAPPLKITLTALFRAMRDPVAEVKKPVDQLMAWSLPAFLAARSVVQAVVVSPETVKGDGMLRTVYPSQVPSYIGMVYRGRVYSPMVIEAIGKPLDGPVDQKGQDTFTKVQMTLASLHSIDRNDWRTWSR